MSQSFGPRTSLCEIQARAVRLVYFDAWLLALFDPFEITAMRENLGPSSRFLEASLRVRSAQASKGWQTLASRRDTYPLQQRLRLYSRTLHFVASPERARLYEPLARMPLRVECSAIEKACNLYMVWHHRHINTHDSCYPQSSTSLAIQPPASKITRHVLPHDNKSDTRDQFGPRTTAYSPACLQC